MTPCSKHYAIQYHWFQEHLGLRNIQLVKISSEEQMGDLFTKGLSGTKFFRLQKKVMGKKTIISYFEREYSRDFSKQPTYHQLAVWQSPELPNKRIFGYLCN
jgi:hypothetical protein